jgi:putative two-component system response regulator
VREYCRLLAVELMTHPQPGCNVDAEFIRYLYLTSPLHDIGKVGIPDAILLKSERLTEHEYEVMKTHTTIGAKTLEDALSQFPNATFLAVARDIAHAHHEKWDGTGYPRSLEGDAIPLAARVLTLADVYDALRSRRPYKLPMTHEQASAIIEQGSGRHFDPRVIRAFQSVQSTFARIAEAMGDEQESLPLAA